MNFEFNLTAPIYMQIMCQIKGEIVSGERQPGSRVESVRDIAQNMGVNPNTVQRALAQLEREGLVFAERTSGRYISSDKNLINTIKDESFRQNIADFASLMQNFGFSKADILRLLQNHLEGDQTNS